MDRLSSQMTALNKVVDDRSYSGIYDSISSLIDRAIIGQLATDASFMPIRDFPAIYAGESLRRIDARLLEMGVDAETRLRLAPQVKRILVRGQALGSRYAPVSDAVLRSVFARFAEEGRNHLRCTACGYHFTSTDMSESRRKIVDECGLALSQRMRMERAADPIKTSWFTGMHIDHVVPRAGWGSTDSVNLQVLCELCNQGKLIFHNGWEALSVLLAGAYSLYFSCGYRPNRTIFYACMVVNESRCKRCERGAVETELTVRPASEWFTPWTADVICYGCVSESGNFRSLD
ncbi:HNH endonuclease [Mycobacterium sp. Root135]|uniref:HNH endonuclease n=1 Tax=Mycobacterium sp. Root135 TaxID=1736457 RepID=UPI0012EA6CF8